MLSNTLISNRFIQNNLVKDSYRILYNYTILSNKSLEYHLSNITKTFYALENSKEFLTFYNDIVEGNWTNKMNSYIKFNDYIQNVYYENYEALDSIYIHFNNPNISIYQRHDLAKKVDFDFDSWYEKYSMNNLGLYQWAISYNNPVFLTNEVVETVTLFKLFGDKNTDMQGILMFNIRREVFDDILKQNNLYKDGYFFIINHDKILNFNNNSANYNLSDKAYSHIYKREEGAFQISGDRNLAIVHTLLKPQNWHLCYIVPENILTSNYQDLVLVNFIISIILLVVAILFIYLIVKKTTSQINLLMERAESIKWKL